MARVPAAVEDSQVERLREVVDGAPMVAGRHAPAAGLEPGQAEEGIAAGQHHTASADRPSMGCQSPTGCGGREAADTPT